MPHPRRFRFGVQLHAAPDRKSWLEKVKRSEDLGYSTIFMPDHFGDQLAPLPALLSAAENSNLRIGTLVLDNDYKHPVVLAKEAATIDLLTEGRLELGIGAGWMRTDYEQSGMTYDPPAVRVDRFEEGVAVLKGLFGDEGAFTFAGEHYAVTDLDGMPKPVQRPHPPLLIGGGGPRVLRIAGREADIVGINFNLAGGEVSPDVGPNGTAEMTDRKIAWVKQGAGERFGDLELNILIFLAGITDDRMAAAERFAPMFQITPEQGLEVPHVLLGSVEEICDQLEERRERFGLSYVVFGDGGLMGNTPFVELAPVVERLAGR